MPVKLVNVSGAMLPLSLDHSVMCGVGPCGCSKGKGAKLNRDKVSGKMTSFRIQHQRHARVVTLLEGEESESLPERVLACQDVKNARSCKPPKLKVIEVKEDEKPTPAPASPPADPTDSSDGEV